MRRRTRRLVGRVWRRSGRDSRAAPGGRRGGGQPRRLGISRLVRSW
uniref:Uncharacterized protein n=1 Tax=Nonomuraea gerenzanensis TaxID=93944 RepID=A0A1M4E0Y5_9ACTN|nr:hypothetical protein BN4615_P1981 [Nonomuraea gerenzanensis]